jgi:phosphate transport system permease protein
MGSSAAMPTSILSSGRTLAIHLYYLAMETRALDKAMATGVMLIIIILVINGITNWLAQRFRVRMAGK